MSAFRRLFPAAFALGLSAVLETGCALPPGPGVRNGVIAPGAYDFGADYYEPFGGFYGGWDRNYNVAPFRHANHRAFFGHGAFGHGHFGHGHFGHGGFGNRGLGHGQFGHGGFGHGGPGHVFVPSLAGGHAGGGHGGGGHGR